MIKKILLLLGIVVLAVGLGIASCSLMQKKGEEGNMEESTESTETDESKGIEQEKYADYWDDVAPEANGEEVYACFLYDISPLDNISLPLEFIKNLYYDVNEFIMQSDNSFNGELVILPDYVSENAEYGLFYLSNDEDPHLIECKVKKADATCEYKIVTEPTTYGEYNPPEEEAYPEYSVEGIKALTDYLPALYIVHLKEEICEFAIKHDVKEKQFIIDESSITDARHCVTFDIIIPNSEYKIHFQYSKMDPECIKRLEKIKKEDEEDSDITKESLLKPAITETAN